MPKNMVSHLPSAIDEFARYLVEQRGENLRRFAQFKNSFEGWLKHEFAAWLCARHELVPAAADEAQNAFDDGDIYLELRVALDGRRVDNAAKAAKIVDLCVRGPVADRWHYIELKCAFAHVNANKQAVAAGGDAWYLQRLTRSESSASTATLLLVGVGFDDARWRETLRRTSSEAELDPSLVRNQPLGAGRLAYWHHQL